MAFFRLGFFSTLSLPFAGCLAFAAFFAIAGFFWSRAFAATTPLLDAVTAVLEEITLTTSGSAASAACTKMIGLFVLSLRRLPCFRMLLACESSCDSTGLEGLLGPFGLLLLAACPLGLVLLRACPFGLLAPKRQFMRSRMIGCVLSPVFWFRCLRLSHFLASATPFIMAFISPSARRGKAPFQAALDCGLEKPIGHHSFKKALCFMQASSGSDGQSAFTGCFWKIPFRMALPCSLLSLADLPRSVLSLAVPASLLSLAAMAWVL